MRSKCLKTVLIIALIIVASLFAVESFEGKNTQSNLRALTPHAFKLFIHTNSLHVKIYPKHKTQTIVKSRVISNTESLAFCVGLTTTPMIKTSPEYNADKTNRLLQKARKKLLIGFLPVIIVTTADRTTLVTPCKIIFFAEENFHIKLSAGTVYPIFEELERDGYIFRLPRRANRLYALTLKGKRSIECLESGATTAISVFIRSLSNLTVEPIEISETSRAALLPQRRQGSV